MIQRKTQSAEYWQSLSLGPSDIDFLKSLLLDAEQPVSTEALAEALVSERCRREDAELRAELGRGVIYQPKKRFGVGDKILFPALEFRLGEVIGVRPGKNPEHGEFEVISVDFGPGRRQRDFAAGLTTPHKLNVDVGDLVSASSAESPASLLKTLAAGVPAVLHAQISQQGDFASFEGHWLPRSLLADIHVGHLNIIEAVIEGRAAPLDTPSLLADLDLPAEVRPEVLAFSLHSALAADGRFDQVGPDGKRAWFLRRLEPAEALQTPPALRCEPVEYERDDLPNDLRIAELELDDEWSDAATADPTPARASLPATSMLLTYPHVISGTLPLNRHARPFFKQGHGARTAVTLIDGRWGQRFTGWIVAEGRYIAGLRGWFEQHKLPAGAYITLERRDDSGEVVVDFRPRRMRREWMRKAQAVDGKLDIQLRKGEVSCEYDDLTILGDEKPEEVEKLRFSPAYQQASLADLVYQIFTDLAGLSQSGTVHAKTVYSALNVVRRCPPGPIFAALVADSRITTIGDGMYRLAI